MKVADLYRAALADVASDEALLVVSRALLASEWAWEEGAEPDELADAGGVLIAGPCVH